MTDQIRDQYFYKGEQYSLLGLTGGDLFSPQDFGMEPFMFHTACSCGYHTVYEITDDTIYLKSLTIYDRNGRYAPIGTAIPLRAHMRPDVSLKERELRKVVLEDKVFYVWDGSSGYGNYGAQYSNMHFQLPFSGIIRLGKDEFEESPIKIDIFSLLYLRNDAIRYRTILDITIEQGKVVRINDRSTEMEEKRRAYLEQMKEKRHKDSRNKDALDILMMELQ